MPENSLALTDMIAGIALAVSVLSWGYSLFIESRIKKRDDRRAAFDATLGNPFAAKLDLLEPILLQLDVICNSAANATDRADKLSDLQKQDHGSWFMTTSGFISAQDPNTFDIAESELHSYWDQMSDIINDLNIEPDSARVQRLRKAANTLGHRFLTKERSEIQRLRART